MADYNAILSYSTFATAVPGYSALPPCASLVYDFAMGDYEVPSYFGNCQIHAGPAAYGKCMCQKNNGDLQTLMAMLIASETAVYSCGLPELSSAIVVFSEFCSQVGVPSIPIAADLFATTTTASDPDIFATTQDFANPTRFTSTHVRETGIAGTVPANSPTNALANSGSSGSSGSSVSSGRITTGQIIAIVAAGITALVLLILMVFACWCLRRRGAKKRAANQPAASQPLLALSKPPSSAPSMVSTPSNSSMGNAFSYQPPIAPDTVHIEHATHAQPGAAFSQNLHPVYTTQHLAPIQATTRPAQLPMANLAPQRTYSVRSQSSQLTSASSSDANSIRSNASVATYNMQGAFRPAHSQMQTLPEEGVR